MREARLAADVDILSELSIAHEIESESLHEARLAADVERVIVVHEIESLREAS